MVERDDYWWVIKTVAQHPEIAKEILRSLYELGAHKRAEYWLAVKTAAQHPEIAKEILPLIKDGYTKGAHKHDEYWSAIETAAQHPEIAKEILRSLYELGAHKRAEYWWAVKTAVQHPKIAKEILRSLYELGAYKHDDYWWVVETVAQHPEIAKKITPDNPFSALLLLFHHVKYRGTKVTKELVRKLLKKHRGDPIINALYQLGIASGWYLRSLLEDVEVLSLYVRHAQKIRGGRKTYKKLYEILPLLSVAEFLGIDTTKHLSNNIEETKRKLIERIKEKVPEALHGALKRRPHSIASVMAYYRAHGKDVEKLLVHDAESLYELKFGHYNLHRKLLDVAKNINSKNIPVWESGLEDLVHALKEEAQHEKLLEKTGETQEEKEFLSAVRWAYQEIVEKGSMAEIDNKTREVISNTKLAKRLGILETVSKINAFLEKRKRGIYSLKVALTPEEHLHAMNVPESCQRAEGVYSGGALAVTGGPALVFYAQDPSGKVVGRTVFTLWEKGEGKIAFVPNNNYGHVNVRTVATNVLKASKIPVHEDIAPPKGFEPGRSRFHHKRFWKDGKGEVSFR